MEDAEPPPAVSPRLAVERDKLPIWVSVEDTFPLFRPVPFTNRRSSVGVVSCGEPRLDGANRPLVDIVVWGPPLTARLNIFLHL
jgi:hypothetical protein